MPVGFEVSASMKDASGGVQRAVRKTLEDSAARGFAESQDRVPVDRGTLLQSGFRPEWDGDKIRWGYTANHARPMEFGTRAYVPPIQPLKEWADRVLGDPGAAYYLQQKIASEGIDEQPYVRPGRDMMRRYLQTRDMGGYIQDEL